MGSRDRPHREAKKKPKDKARAKLQPLMEPPQNVELIRKPRKPKPDPEESDESLIDRADAVAPLRRAHDDRSVRR